MTTRLSEMVAIEAVVPYLKNTTKDGIIGELSGVISAVYPKHNKDEITQALIEREKLGSTGIENGVAIPHAKLNNLEQIIIAVGRSIPGVDFKAHDGNKSHIFFVLLAPANSQGMHLKTLAQLSRILKDDSVRSRLMGAETREEILNILRREDDRLSC